MLKTLFSAKALFVYGLFLVLAGMAIALYLQFFGGLEPCSLCVFQRLAYMVYGLIGLLAIIHHPKSWGARVYAFLQIPVALIGLSIALRQVWLQVLPPGQVTCGPGINYLLQEFPMQKVLQVVWSGSSDCAIVSWRFWNLSMASWSAILFCVLLILSIFIMLKNHNGKSEKANRQ